MVPNHSTLTSGPWCSRMLTSTSSQCYGGSNPIRPPEWQRIPFTSGKSAHHKAFVAPKRCECGGGGGRLRDLCTRERLPPSGQWRDKHEHLYMPMEHAAYLAKPDYICSEATKEDLNLSTAPRHDDPLSRHRLSYLNGGVGSGKATRAIELFRTKKNPRLHPDPSPGQRDAGQGRPGADI